MVSCESAFLAHPQDRSLSLELKQALAFANSIMLVCRSAARRKEAQKVSVGLVVLDREKLEPIACQRRIIVGSRKKMNLMLTIVFGVVGLVLSYGFSVPSEPSTFRLIAAAGVMVGYQLGQLAGRFVRPRPKRFLALIVSALFFVYFAFAYVQTLQLGSVTTSDIVNLGVLLGLSFFWLGFLLPFTRVPNAIESLWSKG
jgi:uncharacterized membrane protein